MDIDIPKSLILSGNQNIEDVICFLPLVAILQLRKIFTVYLLLAEPVYLLPLGLFLILGIVEIIHLNKVSSFLDNQESNLW